MKRSILPLTLAVLMVTSLVATGCGSSTAASGSASSGNLPVIRVAQQGAYDTWPSWEIAQNGLDKKNGFTLKMTYFDAGPQQVQALAAGQDDIAAIGPVPSLVGALQSGLEIVGIADDESQATDILARPDNPVFQTKGYNPKYPDIYGKPSDLKGKDLYVTTVTTGHVLLINYLKALGLTQSDVHVVNMEQPQMLSAFQSGKGDMAVMWSPFTYTGLDKGWKVVANGVTANAPAIIFIVASKQFADAHPDLVVKFLDSYFTQEAQLKANEANEAIEYQKYLKNWSGLSWKKDTATIDMQKHIVYDLKAQLNWFDDSKGPSKIEAFLSDAGQAFTDAGQFTPAQLTQIKQFKYINTSFLKTLAKQKGISQ